MWSEQYASFKDKLLNSEGKILFIKGICKSYKGNNSLNTNEETILNVLD
jgi:hypothetical protein